MKLDVKSCNFLKMMSNSHCAVEYAIDLSKETKGRWNDKTKCKIETWISVLKRIDKEFNNLKKEKKHVE